MHHLILATICFSLSFGLIKSGLQNLNPSLVAFLRLLIASLIFLPFAKNTIFRNRVKAFFIGMVQFGLMYVCFINAFQFLQGNEVAILTTSTPIFVGIFSAFFGAKFKPLYIACILLSILGAIIIIAPNTTFNATFKGIILMETCNASFAIGQVLWKKYIGTNTKNLMFMAYFGATVFALPFFLKDADIATLRLTVNQILAILYLGIVPTGLGFFLWNKGSKLISYGTLAIMNNLKIPFGVLFSIFLFGEKINLISFSIGSSILLLALVLTHKIIEK